MCLGVLALYCKFLKCNCGLVAPCLAKMQPGIEVPDESWVSEYCLNVNLNNPLLYHEKDNVLAAIILK